MNPQPRQETDTLSDLRARLDATFSDAELRVLCYQTPAFRPVYDHLTPNTTKAQLLRHLLNHAQHTQNLDHLPAPPPEKVLPPRGGELEGGRVRGRAFEGGS